MPTQTGSTLIGAGAGSLLGPVGMLLGGGIGSLFGGGGGHDVYEVVRYLRNQYGLDIPRGFNARKFGKAELLGQMLTRLGGPTGLEGFFGPEFQSRAVSSTLEQTGAPFQEAGRALTSGYLRSGQGGGGQLAAGRQQLATAQGQAQGSSIAQLLMGLEGQRAGIAGQMEDIRSNRIAQLANFINQLQVMDVQRDQSQQAARGAAGQGIGSALGGLLTLIGLCVVAEELFGKDAEETHLARYWVRFLAPAWFRKGYAAHGPQIAELARKDPDFREAIRPLFLWFARMGADALQGEVA